MPGGPGHPDNVVGALSCRFAGHSDSETLIA